MLFRSMGDVETLIEKAQAAIDEEQAAALEQSMRKGEFDFNDFLSQLEQMEKLGDMNDIIGMIPGMSQKMGKVDIDPSAMTKPRAIIQSMTEEERSHPEIINVSRKQRIAKGCGMDIAEVNRFMKQFEQSKKMMKQFSNMMGGKGSKKRRRGGFRMPFGF